MKKRPCVYQDGHRFLADLVLGSTANKLRHRVDIPVLLLRAPAKLD